MVTAFKGGSGIKLKSRSSTNQNVADLITEVRDNISEFTAEYFTDDRILRWINRAYQDVYNQLASLSQNHFVSTTTFSLIADQQEYSLPSDFKRSTQVARITDAGGTTLETPYNLEKINIHDRFSSPYVRAGRWTPSFFYISGSKIGFVNIPATTESAGSIKMWYIQQPAILTSGGTHSLLYEYSNLIILLASYYALRAEKETGESFFRDYKDALLLLKHEQATRDSSWPDQIRHTDWNE